MKPLKQGAPHFLKHEKLLTKQNSLGYLWSNFEPGGGSFYLEKDSF